MTTKIVKASDPDILHLAGLGWYTYGYYFTPLTNEVFSRLANKATENNLYKLKPHNRGNDIIFNLCGRKFTINEFHVWFKERKDSKYLKIMASKATPQTTDMTTKIVKASDSNLVQLSGLAGYPTGCYYFNPLTNELFSRVANNASPENLYKLKSTLVNGNVQYRVGSHRYSDKSLHNWCERYQTETYNRIMASKTTPQPTVANPIETPKFEKVSDWHTLKVGDRIKTDDPATNVNEVVTVIDRERVEYGGHWAVKVEREDGSDTFWINTSYQINKQAPIETPKQESPSNGWVIMELDSGGSLISLDDSGSIDVYKSEDDAFRFVKQLCDTHHNTTFVKLKIENFGVTTSTPTFQLT